MTSKRIFMIAFSLIGLMTVFLMQKQIQLISDGLFQSKFTAFAFSRTLRFLINDLLVIQLIYGIFSKKKYVIFALYVQLAGIVIVLAPYLSIKYFTTYNGPLISFLHRLVVNPLLMILLIPAFYYQNKITKNE